MSTRARQSWGCNLGRGGQLGLQLGPRLWLWLRLGLGLGLGLRLRLLLAVVGLAVGPPLRPILSEGCRHPELLCHRGQQADQSGRGQRRRRRGDLRLSPRRRTRHLRVARVEDEREAVGAEVEAVYHQPARALDAVQRGGAVEERVGVGAEFVLIHV